MEKILVGIDFSESSKNAAEYAANVAAFFSAHLVLFHAFSLPMPYPEAGVIFSVDDYEKDALSNLSLVKNELQKKHPQIQMSLVTKLGEGEIAIDEELASGKYDMVVVGIDKEAGVLHEYFIGSTATAIARNAKAPTLIIPNTTSFSKIRKIAYACDYTHDFRKSNVLIYLKFFAKLLDAELILFNIVNDKSKFTIDLINQEIHVEKSLEKISPTFVYSSNKDVTEGIINLSREHQIDWLITSPAKHHFFYEWYHESNTKKLAFHGGLPLLCLPMEQ